MAQFSRDSGNRTEPGTDDDDFIRDADDTPPGRSVPRPARFADGRPTGNAVILAQQDGRLGYDTDDPPVGLDAAAAMLHDARNARDLPDY